VSRVFNFIECYLFRFLFVGIFIVLILHPLANIFIICLYLALSLLSPVWVLIILLLGHLVQIFIWDYNIGYKR